MKHTVQMAKAGIPSAGQVSKFKGFRYGGGNKPAMAAKSDVITTTKDRIVELEAKVEELKNG